MTAEQLLQHAGIEVGFKMNTEKTDEGKFHNYELTLLLETDNGSRPVSSAFKTIKAERPITNDHLNIKSELLAEAFKNLMITFELLLEVNDQEVDFSSLEEEENESRG